MVQDCRLAPIQDGENSALKAAAVANEARQAVLRLERRAQLGSVTSADDLDLDEVADYVQSGRRFTKHISLGAIVEALNELWDDEL